MSGRERIGRRVRAASRHAIAVAAMVASCAPLVHAQDARYGNWFHDPFFQVRSAVAGCTQPLGPFMTEAEATAESHYRIERGTSCFLAGQCAKPNAYLYDAEIAEAVRKRFLDPSLAPVASLWITVKRRFVWVEGCRAPSQSMDGLETQLKSIADVQMVLINVTDGTQQRLPYAVLPPGAQVIDTAAP